MSEKNYDSLRKFGEFQDSFDDVITKILNKIDTIVASLSIKRIPESGILNEVKTQIGKSITKQTLYNARNRIKKESAKWYSQLRQGEYEYIHEFRERINEIVDLQRRHYKIIEDNANNPSIQQTSLSELHKLNITLSNYFDVAPAIGITLSATPESKTTEQRKNFIV